MFKCSSVQIVTPERSETLHTFHRAQTSEQHPRRIEAGRYLFSSSPANQRKIVADGSHEAISQIGLETKAHMPYVNVRITKDGVTVDQKRQIIKEITQTLLSVLGKKPEHIHIIIDEIEPENWGFAGTLTTEYRDQYKKE